MIAAVFLKAPGTGVKDIATKSLYIQSKKFYIDIKEGKRGKFMKLAEVSFFIALLCELYVHTNKEIIYWKISFLRRSVVQIYFICKLMSI